MWLKGSVYVLVLTPTIKAIQTYVVRNPASLDSIMHHSLRRSAVMANDITFYPQQINIRSVTAVKFIQIVYSARFISFTMIYSRFLKKHYFLQVSFTEYINNCKGITKTVGSIYQTFTVIKHKNTHLSVFDETAILYFSLVSKRQKNKTLSCHAQNDG